MRAPELRRPGWTKRRSLAEIALKGKRFYRQLRALAQHPDTLADDQGERDWAVAARQGPRTLRGSQGLNFVWTKQPSRLSIRPEDAARRNLPASEEAP